MYEFMQIFELMMCLKKDLYFIVLFMGKNKKWKHNFVSIISMLLWLYFFYLREESLIKAQLQSHLQQVQ